MISTQHTQSLTDFRQNASETLERINRTGNAEIITVNGEARAVLLSPEEYDRLAGYAVTDEDVAMMKRSIEQLERGEGIDGDVFFDGLRAKLLAMKQEQERKTA